MEYERLEPFGEARADLRMAQTCLTFARVMGAKDVKLDDFLFEFGKDDLDELQEAKQRAGKLEAMAALLTQALGGQDRRASRPGLG